MPEKIFVTKTYLPPRDTFNRYVDQIYSTNVLTNFGSLHCLLEERLKKYLGVEHIVLMSNGTLALQIALRALPSNPEKKSVITSPFSFVATTSSIVWEGFSPVFADIDPDTFNLCPEKVEDLLKKRKDIHAILAVHVYGAACDVEAFDTLSKKYGVPVIYDAAHAFGSAYKDQSLLNFGELSTLSFHATKIFHTIEGGAIVAKSEEQAKKIKNMINFGIIGPDKITELGVNCKMNEFQAAMGLSVLENMEKVVTGRRRVYEAYVDKIPSKYIVPKKNLNLPNYSYFPTLLPSEDILLELRSRFENENIFARRYFYPSLNSLAYLNSNSLTSVCDDISKRVFCLPMYESLSTEDVERICKIFNSTMG